MNLNFKPSRTQTIGNIGEQWAYDQLTKRGYDVIAVPDYFKGCADLKIGTLPVEVKYSRISYRSKRLVSGKRRWYKRWQWNVSELDSADRVLFLIAEDKAGIRHPFIMPGAIMADRQQFEISRHPTEYKGFVKGYLNRWETVDLLLAQSYYDDRQFTIYHYLVNGEDNANQG